MAGTMRSIMEFGKRITSLTQACTFGRSRESRTSKTNFLSRCELSGMLSQEITAMLALLSFWRASKRAIRRSATRSGTLSGPSLLYPFSVTVRVMSFKSSDAASSNKRWRSLGKKSASLIEVISVRTWKSASALRTSYMHPLAVKESATSLFRMETEAIYISSWPFLMA